MQAGHVFKTKIAGEFRLLVLIGVASFQVPIQVNHAVFYRDGDGAGVGAFIDGGNVRLAGEALPRVRDDCAGGIERAEPNLDIVILLQFGQGLPDQVFVNTGQGEGDSIGRYFLGFSQLGNCPKCTNADPGLRIP